MHSVFAFMENYVLESKSHPAQDFIFVDTDVRRAKPDSEGKGQ